MMTVQEFAEKLLQVAQQTSQEGITLWGGYRDLQEVCERLGGEVVTVAPAAGCTSETCHHVSHDPAAPTYKWVPPQDAQLVRLGGEQDEYEGFSEWYAVFHHGEVHFVEAYKPRFYWGAARIVDADCIPEWALVKLHNRVVGE